MDKITFPIEILCCYSSADEQWLHKLEIHLSLLKHQSLISFWHAQLIAPGSDWTQEMEQHLETASVILLLISADFLASDYCYSVQMGYALDRQREGKSCVIPLLVRAVDWKEAPFAHLRVLPTNTQPLASWQDEDRALADVTSSIRQVIENLQECSTSNRISTELTTLSPLEQLRVSFLQAQQYLGKVTTLFEEAKQKCLPPHRFRTACDALNTIDHALQELAIQAQQMPDLPSPEPLEREKIMYQTKIGCTHIQDYLLALCLKNRTGNLSPLTSAVLEIGRLLPHVDTKTSD
jgi:hypothetical protein